MGEVPGNRRRVKQRHDISPPGGSSRESEMAPSLARGKMDAHTLRHESKLQLQVPQDQVVSKLVDRTTSRPPRYHGIWQARGQTHTHTHIKFQPLRTAGNPAPIHNTASITTPPETARRTSRSRDGRNLQPPFRRERGLTARVSHPGATPRPNGEKQETLGTMVRPETA
ncbi:hypothetical protein CPLU01_00738 [Colletotrichum plurivorum]|uniref:Uncharacterized protein n=1 Tax=Colletotrichum plurivorum TaxID=2175906 RepID=A0A8H6NRF2_9PEZI|nr:hypothetical protein CPLU01_00738 [Colletotrichum plurivorum]